MTAQSHPISRRTSLFRAGAFLLILLVGTLALPVVAGAAEDTGGKLFVVGKAEVKAEPDMAQFSVGVETRGKTVEEARRLNAEAMEGVRSRLLDAGIDPKALQTKGFNLYPEWQYNPDDGSRTLTGYRVTHTLEITVTDLEKLGTWLDAAMAEGANRISGPTFGISNPEELEAQALREAVKRARGKAEILARATGVYLKGIAQINEQVSLPPAKPIPMTYRTLEAADAAATSISTGEVSVSATVSITYNI